MRLLISSIKRGLLSSLPRLIDTDALWAKCYLVPATSIERWCEKVMRGCTGSTCVTGRCSKMKEQRDNEKPVYGVQIVLSNLGAGAGELGESFLEAIAGVVRGGEVSLV